MQRTQQLEQQGCRRPSSIAAITRQPMSSEQAVEEVAREQGWHLGWTWTPDLAGCRHAGGAPPSPPCRGQACWPGLSPGVTTPSRWGQGSAGWGQSSASSADAAVKLCPICTSTLTVLQHICLHAFATATPTPKTCLNSTICLRSDRNTAAAAGCWLESRAAWLGSTTKHDWLLHMCCKDSNLILLHGTWRVQGLCTQPACLKSMSDSQWSSASHCPSCWPCQMSAPEWHTIQSSPSRSTSASCSHTHSQSLRAVPGSTCRCLLTDCSPQTDCSTLIVTRKA